MHKSNLMLLVLLSLGILRSMFAGPALSYESATPSNSLSPPTIVDSNSGKLHFSKGEQDWLSQNHVVHVRVGDYAPIQLFNKIPSGIAVDYLNAIAEKIGIHIEYQREIHWADTLNKIRDRKGVDLLLGAMSTEERRKYLTFTETYLSFPSVIFTREDSSFISSLQDLSGKIVAVQNKVVVHDLLVEKYPDLKLLLKETEEDALQSLVTGESDAYVGNLTVGSFYIQSNGWNNAKVAAPTGFDPQNLSMAVRSDWPELASIINKVLATFKHKEHAAILNKWMSPIRYEYGISTADILKWSLGVSSIALAIFITILIWNKRLKVEINSRTKVEKTLKQLLETFELAQKMAKIGHWRYNIETQQPIWSEQMFMVLGCDPDKGVPNYEAHKKIFHPDDWEMFDKAVQGSINGIPYNIEARLIFSDGSIHWCNAQGFPHYDQYGNIVELFGTTQDITKRKQAGEALQTSEEKYRIMMESMKDASYICSSEMHVEYMNPAMIDRVGNDATGELCYKAIYDMDEKCPWCVFDQIKKGEHVDYEVVDPKDNNYYSVSNSPIAHSDGIVSKLTIFRDITEIKAMEENLRQAQKMDSLGTLTGGIAHDFNNLLYMIVGNTEMALEDIPKYNPVHSNLEEIKSASLRAAGIVKQLLNFSRKADHKMKPINAVAVIKDAIKFMRSTIPSTIEIRNQLPDNEVPILGDPVQINQVIMNLCTNSSQAMEETGGILTINVETLTLDENADVNYHDLPGGDYLKIMLSDTGPGISTEIINKIFDPYFTTKEIGKGSGMGLSIVHGIVKNHDGIITVDSKPDKGTIFTILLPVVDEKPVDDIETTSEKLFGTESILFVDDEESLTKMTGNMLERLGYQVETSLNPIEALDLFQSKPEAFDIVITDMTMPQMTGAKFSEKLMKIRPDIPVIICTGHSSLIDEEKAKQLGIAGYVMKPVSMSKIAKTIRKVLDK